MRRRLLALAVLALATPAAPAVGATPRASLPDVEDEVMCVECGTALNISESAVADQERAFIRHQIAQGRDKEQIKAALVDEFGPGVLALPERDGFSLAVYLVPALLALLALAGVAVAARRWRRNPEPARADEPAAPSAEDTRRLDAELAAYEKNH
ncbi:MAG: cytochrome c-type biogenesis protein [Solirubrobacteraceae bacterium]